MASKISSYNLQIIANHATKAYFITLHNLLGCECNVATNTPNRLADMSQVGRMKMRSRVF